MKIRRLAITALLLSLIILSITGCGGGGPRMNSASEQQRVVARADLGYQLTLADLTQKLQKSMLMPLGGEVPDSALKGFVDSILIDTLTGFEADSLDIAKHFHANWSYRTRSNALFLYNYMESRLSGISVDSSEVVTFYEQNKQRYEAQEQVEISHILSTAMGLLNGPDSSSYRIMPESVIQRSTHEYVEWVYKKLDSGMSFAEAAYQFSHASSAKRDSGYFGLAGRGEFHAPFDSIAFELTPGSYSQPYQDQDGWHILYLHSRREPGIPPLTDSVMYNTVSQQVLSDKMRSRAGFLFDSLGRNVTFVLNETLLDSNLYHTTDSLWFGIVNGVDTVDVLTMRNAEETIKRRLRVWNTTPDQKRDVFGMMARQYAVVQAAKTERLDTLPQVVAKLKEIRHQESKAYLMQQWFDLSYQPTDSAIEHYYRSHPKQFEVNKPLTVQHILTKDSSIAIFVRDQARAGVDFMELAREFYTGEETVREELADLGKIGPEDVDSNFYRAALVLAPGEVSDPIKTRYGFHVIKLLKNEQSKSLDEARVEIITRLTKEHQMSGFWKIRDDLFKRYHVRISGLPKKLVMEPLAYRAK